jgi:opacity protein-like surface antigen
LNRILLTASLILGILGLAAIASAQDIPKWELYGGYSEDLAGAGLPGQKQLPTNGVQAELARVVTSYFRISGQFNAQFADHVVNIAPPPPPGGMHVNSKELLGLFGPEATYRGLRRFDIYGHFLMGVAYGRDNEFPKIPTATYTTWAYALGGGLELKLGHRVSARLIGFDWITTHFPVNSPEAQDNWRLTGGFVFHLGK